MMLRALRTLFLLLLPLPAAAMAISPSAETPAGFSLGTLSPATAGVFGNYMPAPQSPPPGMPGFADMWLFDVSTPATIDTWVASYSLGGSFGIQGLQMRLVEVPTMAMLQGWSVATSSGSGPVLSTATLAPYSPLVVGTTYGIQVQGTAYGLSGGAYSGGFNLDVAAPVPLPAALPLFIGALGVLGLASQRRR